MRERDKKGYPQFIGRIIEWKNNGYKKGKVFCVRVVGFDYHIGITFVDVNDNTQNFTCYNGPLSPNGKTSVCDYDKAFEYALNIMRTNGMYNVQDAFKVSGEEETYGTLYCAFGV